MTSTFTKFARAKIITALISSPNGYHSARCGTPSRMTPSTTRSFLVDHMTPSSAFTMNALKSSKIARSAYKNPIHAGRSLRLIVKMKAKFMFPLICVAAVTLTACVEYPYGYYSQGSSSSGYYSPYGYGGRYGYGGGYGYPYGGYGGGYGYPYGGYGGGYGYPYGGYGYPTVAVGIGGYGGGYGYPYGGYGYGGNRYYGNRSYGGNRYYGNRSYGGHRYYGNRSYGGHQYSGNRSSGGHRRHHYYDRY
jgi:hypothetical protein